MEGWDTGLVRYGRLWRERLEAWAPAMLTEPGGFLHGKHEVTECAGLGKGCQKRYRWHPCRELGDSKDKLHSLCNCTHSFHKNAPSLHCTSATVLSARELKKRSVTTIPTVTRGSSQASWQIAPQTPVMSSVWSKTLGR